jgi:hypothetical protein
MRTDSVGACTSVSRNPGMTGAPTKAGIVARASASCVALASEEDVGRGQESKSEEEPAQLTPAGDEQ